MKNLLVLFSLSLAFCSFSQYRKEWGIEYRQKIGFLVANRGVMGHLPNRLALAGELSVFFNTKGRKQWHGATGFPPLGVTFFGGSVGNNEILGRYYGVYSFIEFPFVKTKHFEFLGKLGSGIGYTSKVFDYDKNPKNVAISTHFNALICFGVKSNFNFNRNKITLGLDMTHFSNGAYQVPNIGINLPYFSLGYARIIQKASNDSIVIPNVLPLRKWLFGLTAIASVKEIFPSGGKKYPVYCLNASWRWFSKPKVGFEGAIDVISKQAIMAYKPEIVKSQWDILQVGLYMGYLLPLDQFHFAIGMGVYVKDKYQPEDSFYHRVGMRYYFKNGIHTQLVLKSHWARADYFEWGVGYTFNFTKK
jgi:hypothetical protein